MNFILLIKFKKWKCGVRGLTLLLAALCSETRASVVTQQFQVLDFEFSETNVSSSTEEQGVGPRVVVRASFELAPSVGAALRNNVKKERQIGLFLKRPRGAVASVQRGVLESCHAGYCKAVFEGNDALSFYRDEAQDSSRWYIQVLQNPVIRERMLELENPAETAFISRSKLYLEYGRQSVVLSESSSTPFNASKESKKQSFGNAFRARLELNKFDVNYKLYQATLDTKGFFTDDFVTRVSDREISAYYNFLTYDYFLIGAGLGHLDYDFITTNDDEAILNTKYQSWSSGVQLRYIVPIDLLRLFGGAFVLEAGQGATSFSLGLLGSAKDTGDYKRGESASWKHWRWSYEHTISTRASSKWLDRIHLGFMYQFQKNANQFSGAADGPSTGLPEGTVSAGTQNSWGFQFGREFILK